ncbi:MAG: alpha/beta hydrolase [Deltaproteobacteria bacterium]|nr:alpha/beta hydrolase [Deltaproteobacteria bacterium]
MLRKVLRWLGVVVGALALVLLLIVAVHWAPDRPVSQLEPRWAQPPSTFVEVGGMRVHVRDEGPRDDPKPIVLLHGTSASLHTWEGWARALRDKRRVIRFDLPGFALTGPSPDGRYDIESYVRFTRAMLDRLAVRRCVLAGNSLGGKIAWETALADAGRVEALVLVDAGGYPMESQSMPIGFRLAKTPVVNRLTSLVLPRSIIVSSLRDVYGDPTKVTPELIDLYFDMAIREGNRRALVARFAQTQHGAGSERIAQLKIPTLVMWGGRDRLLPPAHGERFHREVAGSKLVIFDDLGHVPHEEDPARTVAAVQGFLGGT